MLRWRQMWAVPLRAVMNRADRGLYGGKEILFGNNVSHSMRHTRRTWKPNVQSKTFYSEILERTVSLRATTYALRWIDKAGGFDRYILHTPDRKLASNIASELKQEMLHQLAVRRLTAAQQALLRQTSS